MAIKVRMLEPGFIEGKRVKPGDILFLKDPSVVSFKAMELFKKDDIDVVKKAKAEFSRANKKKTEEQKKLEPKIVNPDADAVETFKVDPESGDVSSYSEISAKGESGVHDFTKSVI